MRIHLIGGLDVFRHRVIFYELVLSGFDGQAAEPGEFGTGQFDRLIRFFSRFEHGHQQPGMEFAMVAPEFLRAHRPGTAFRLRTAEMQQYIISIAGFGGHRVDPRFLRHKTARHRLFRSRFPMFSGVAVIRHDRFPDGFSAG